MPSSEPRRDGGERDGQGAVVLDDGARKTYRYLRVSIVAMALLLAVSLAVEILGGGERLGSISDYYYSPVRSVFVGALLAIGVALIAIRGWPDWEDTLLDLAGMVIPTVALVPVAVDLGEDVCGPGVERCLPPDLVPAIENNVTALLVVGAAVLAFAWWSAARGRGLSSRVGLVTATTVWLVSTLWFMTARDLFLAGAHYVAAVLFFLLLAVVAYLHGRSVQGRTHVRLMSPRRFAGTYRVLSALMVGTIVGAGVLLGGSSLAGVELWYATIFLIEAVLLALFVAFWVLQTAENWDEEGVEDATCRDDAAS